MDSPFTLVADLQAQLAEGPVWDSAAQCLTVTDIPARTLWRISPQTGESQRREIFEEVGCFAPSLGGGLVAACRSGIWSIPDAAEATCLARNPEAHQSSRFNDGRIDPKGRLWAGTVDPYRQERAGLYRYDRRGLVRFADGLMTSNGLAFSPDGRLMYHSDTPRFRIYVYDYDQETGTPSNRRIFAQLTPTDMDQGRPDGAAVDAEGCYWSAFYQGARVVRFAPNGDILASYRVPAQSPTMPCFGGPDMRTLFVTSARDGSSPEQLAQYPHSGGVFAMRVDVPGIAIPPFNPEI